MDEAELEGLAAGAVQSAGLDPDEPTNPLVLARRLVGPVVRVHAAALPGDGALARVHGERRIYVRGQLAPERLRWAVGHEVAEALLADAGYQEPDVELVANRLAACLLAPQRAVVRATRATGERFPALARALGTTQSCAALRLGEATGRPLALITPVEIRYRGEAFAWPPAEKLRARRQAPGIHKVRLRDAVRRVVAQANAR